MIELLIVGAFVLVPLFLAIPLIGKYLDIRAAAVQGARYAAWERTVWYGGAAASKIGWFGSDNQWRANAKSDDQIRREMGVRQLSNTGPNDAFHSTNDRSSSNFAGGSPAIWHDRSGQAMLRDYSAIGNAVGNFDAPGTLNRILTPIANFAATLGPFTLETKGKYTASVTLNVRDIDYDHFLLKNSTKSFTESSVLLANGWSADGPDDAQKTSVKQQVRGLVPLSILDNDIVTTIRDVLSVFLPEVSKLELGKIDPETVPPDRLK